MRLQQRELRRSLLGAVDDAWDRWMAPALAWLFDPRWVTSNQKEAVRARLLAMISVLICVGAALTILLESDNRSGSELYVNAVVSVVHLLIYFWSLFWPHQLLAGLVSVAVTTVAALYDHRTSGIDEQQLTHQISYFFVALVVINALFGRITKYLLVSLELVLVYASRYVMDTGAAHWGQSVLIAVVPALLALSSHLSNSYFKFSELQLEINKSQNKFLAHVSHELRTPLHHILGVVDFLLVDSKARYTFFVQQQPTVLDPATVATEGPPSVSGGSTSVFSRTLPHVAIREHMAVQEERASEEDDSKHRGAEESRLPVPPRGTEPQQGKDDEEGDDEKDSGEEQPAARSKSLTISKSAQSVQNALIGLEKGFLAEEGIHDEQADDEDEEEEEEEEVSLDVSSSPGDFGGMDDDGTGPRPLTDGFLEEMQMLMRIRHSANLILSVVNNVFDLSRIDSDTLHVHVAPTNLPLIVKQVVRAVSSKTDNDQVTTVLDIDGSVPPFVECDAARIQQVLLNLIANAINHTHVGSVTVRVRSLSERGPRRRQGRRNSNKQDIGARPLEPGVKVSTDHEWVRFEVIDTGSGMDDATMSRCFQRFRHVDAADDADIGTQATSGLGLGLHVSIQIVNIMGGFMDVNSELGEGSKFWFDIPVKRTTVEATKMDQRSTSMSTYDGTDPQQQADARDFSAAAVGIGDATSRDDVGGGGDADDEKGGDKDEDGGGGDSDADGEDGISQRRAQSMGADAIISSAGSKKRRALSDGRRPKDRSESGLSVDARDVKVSLFPLRDAPAEDLKTPVLGSGDQRMWPSSASPQAGRVKQLMMSPSSEYVVGTDGHIGLAAQAVLDQLVSSTSSPAKAPRPQRSATATSTDSRFDEELKRWLTQTTPPGQTRSPFMARTMSTRPPARRLPQLNKKRTQVSRRPAAMRHPLHAQQQQQLRLGVTGAKSAPSKTRRLVRVRGRLANRASPARVPSPLPGGGSATAPHDSEPPSMVVEENENENEEEDDKGDDDDDDEDVMAPAVEPDDVPPQEDSNVRLVLPNPKRSSQRTPEAILQAVESLMNQDEETRASRPSSQQRRTPIRTPEASSSGFLTDDLFGGSSSDSATPAEGGASQPASRSTSMSLVREEKSNRLSAESTSSSGDRGSGGSKAAVLVVDDNDTNRKLLCRFMSRAKIKYRTAVNGQEALLKWEKHRYPVVLMDIMMPVMDGKEAMRHIRAHTEFAQPHIVAVTASTMTVEEAVEMGFDGLITKPFRMQTIVKTTKRSIKENKQRRIEFERAQASTDNNNNNNK